MDLQRAFEKDGPGPRFVSRDCLQPQQTTDDFARHRAFFEHLLERAHALLSAIGIAALSPCKVYIIPAVG